MNTILKPNYMKTSKLLLLPVLLSAVIVCASASRDGGKEIEKLHDSAGVITEFSKMKENLPTQLMEQYKGIVVIPSMANVGFGVGAKQGNGVATVKLPNGKWSDPVFVTLTGGNYGLTSSAESVDLILVFQHKGVLTRLKAGDYFIGPDVTDAAGPITIGSSGNSHLSMDAEIYSYSSNNGMLKGLTIDGAKLSIDKKANADYYGGPHALFGASGNGTVAVKTLTEALKGL
jgi:SH3 domain-containing YSC84-like protein 1